MEGSSRTSVPLGTLGVKKDQKDVIEVPVKGFCQDYVERHRRAMKIYNSEIEVGCRCVLVGCEEVSDFRPQLKSALFGGETESYLIPLKSI